jgi:glycosyltransferase involved in cell wall biosynthesis
MPDWKRKNRGEGRMRVLHIVTGLNGGGAETMLYRLLSRMDRAAFENEVASLMDVGSVGRKIQELGIRVHALGMARGKPNPGALWSLVNIVCSLRPHLVQGWMYHGNLAAAVAGILTRIPTPVLWNIRHTPYDLGDYSQMTAATIRLGACFSRYPARILYNSRTSALRHEALGYAAARRAVFPNGFDLARFAPSAEARVSVRSELGIGQEAPLVGLVARFHPQKDHRSFIQAAALFRACAPGSHFLLCGDGITWDNPPLVGWIEVTGIRDCCHLLGRREDVPRLMAALDIGSIASSAEAFPNVIGEAMACGVPCVVTDVGDLAVIVGETGVVVPPKDPQALADGWRRLLLDMSQEDRMRLGLAARQRIVENYSLEKIVEQYERLYESLVTSSELPVGRSDDRWRKYRRYLRTIGTHFWPPKGLATWRSVRVDWTEKVYESHKDCPRHND